MADIDLTKEIVKALDPNFLLAQENLTTNTDITKAIDSTSKSQAGLNYIKKGIQKVFRSTPTPTVNKVKKPKMSRHNIKNPTTPLTIKLPGATRHGGKRIKRNKTRKNLMF